MMYGVVRGLQVGDLFRLSIDEHRVGYGQIVEKYQGQAYYFVIYEQPHEHDDLVDPESVVAGDVALLALSLDALIARGDWELVTNRQPPALTWPVYAESVAPGVFEAVDHTGTVRRRVNPDEAARLPTRSIVAPVRVQNAFRALHGAAQWNSAFDQLRYSAGQAS
jgi:hypothetical protein